MKTFLSLLFIPVLILFTGCLDTLEVQIDDEPLTGELTISDDHIQTLSEITYTVQVKESHGNHVTDMETVEVQHKAHDDSEWSSTELTLDGNVYTGTYTFNSSGEYDLRVSGIRHGGTEMEVLHEMHDHMHVGRIHKEVGNYRIEYEHFPAHLHEGDTATVKFWVFENEEDASGERPPVTGLDGLHIHCTNPDGTGEHHTDVTEESDGVYVDEHTFIGAGEAKMGTHFPAPHHDSEIEAEFHLEVAHGH